ncbi:HupE/UreJ family protein [Metabacillus sp. FJAT-53654]|uniref:HupE/UreJ family protein n=1 Tax=Metabacillus rhizosphaerae TaxID=3117747 RepID=A0ABZ2MY40_9BACI
MKHKLLVLILIIIAVTTSVTNNVEAHSMNSEGFSTIRVQEDHITYELLLDQEEFIHATGVQIDAEPNEITEENNKILQSYFDENLELYSNGVLAKGKIDTIKPIQLEERPFVSITISFPVEHTPESLNVDYNVFFETDPSHANVAKIEIDGNEEEFVFTYEVRELNTGEMNFLTSAKQFLVLGIEHIFTGYDHILFAISLLIGAKTFRQIITLITTFTIAHSITLVLATIGLVQLPGRLVESVIALSIIYVALHNITQPNSKQSPWLVLIFGLVHGFGFAGILSEMNLSQGNFATSILFFNLGIELGQVIILSLIYPVILFIQKKQYYKWFAPSVSTAILLFGLVWFFQRAF